MPFKCFCRFAIYKFFWLPLIPSKSQCSESNVRSVLLNFKQLFVLPFFSSLYFQIQNPLDLFRNHGLLDVDRPISETVSAAVCHGANIFDSILGILCCFIALTQYLSWFCSFWYYLFATADETPQNLRFILSPKHLTTSSYVINLCKLQINRTTETSTVVIHDPNIRGL